MIENDSDIYIENTSSQIADYLLSIHGKNEFEQNGSAYLNLALSYRSRACLKLLSHLDRENFSDDLLRSVQTWIFYITSSDTKLDNNQYACGTRFGALCDALVIGQLNAAAKVDSYFPQSFNPDYEYEDDYLFFKLLGQLILNLIDKDVSQIFNLLDRWEVVLEGGDSALYNTMLALVNVDSANFTESLHELLQERNEKFDKWKETSFFNSEVEQSNRFIYINGLAMLQVSSLYGIKIDEAFDLLPSAAIFSENHSPIRENLVNSWTSG